MTRLDPTRSSVVLLPVLFMLACGSESAATSSETGEGETAAETGASGSNGAADGQDEASSSGSESSGASTSSSESSTSGGDGDGDGDENVIRFVVLGDGGEGNENQFLVANALELVCAERGCEFALYLGDNFYDSGVDSAMDAQFESKFELPYADLDFPFYATMGNHDYGGFIGGVFANEWGKLQYEVEYTSYSDKWVMLDKWYSFDHKGARFISIDSARMMFEYEQEEQKAWFSNAALLPGADWNIVFAHHPYISNGAHGNAGNYEGIPWPDQVSGGDVKDFIEQQMCFNIDLYFTGHDHNRQWLEPRCGVEFIVSGAAAKVTPFEHRDDNAVFFEDDQKPGFMWVELNGKTMTGAFYDLDGNLDFERSYTKP